MAYLNKTLLIGRLGQDPESRYTENGKMVVTFSLATSSGKDKPTEWHNIVCWEKTAELACDYLKKGSQVYIEGRGQTRTWDKDGQKQYRHEVVASTIQFLDKIERTAAAEEESPF